MNEDFYSILGVASTATAAEIKERYRYLSHAYHPDKFATKAQRDSAERKKREFVAKRYYEEHIEGLAKEGYFDNEALKRWFIRTATLILQQAPIKERYPFDDMPSYAIRYRNIPFDDMPRMQRWRVLLVKEIPALALGAAVLTTFAAALCFLVIRWIGRGFRRIPATT